MNKYLEKIATWKNPAKFVGYLTGKTSKNATSRVRNMEEAIANKWSLDDVKKMETHAKSQTTKARLAAGAAGTVAAGGAAIAYKKVRDKQNAETMAQYQNLLKSADIGGAAKTLAGAGGSAVWKTLRRVGGATADMMNSAGGGKIKDYATRHGYKPGNKDYKHFVGSDLKGQVKSMLRKGNVTKKNTGPKTRAEFIKGHTQNLGNLHRHSRDAKIGLGSIGAAGVSAYGWKKARDTNKKNHQYY